MRTIAIIFKILLIAAFIEGTSCSASLDTLEKGDIKVEAFVRTGCSEDQVTASQWILSCCYSGVDIKHISSINWIRYIPQSTGEKPFSKHVVVYNWKPGQVQTGALLDLKNRVDAVTFTNNCLKLKIRSLIETDRRHWECRVSIINEDQPYTAFKDVSRACVDNVDPDEIYLKSKDDTTTILNPTSSNAQGDGVIMTAILSALLAVVFVVFILGASLYIFRDQIACMVKLTDRPKRKLSGDAQPYFGQEVDPDETRIPLLSSEEREMRRRGISSISSNTKQSTNSSPKHDHLYKLIKMGLTKEVIIQRLSKHPEEADEGWGWEQSTPLMEAARLGRADIIQVLLGWGVDVNKQDESNYTALIWAAIGNHPGTAQQLLSAGANVLIFNHTRASSVMYAASARDPCVLALFLDTMSEDTFREVNVPDSYGNSPLHWSSYRGRTDQCIMLCAAGAEEQLKVKGFNHQDPRELALENDHPETAKVLKQMLDNNNRDQSNAQMYLETAVNYGIQSLVTNWLAKVKHIEDLKTTDGKSFSDLIATKNVYCYPNTKNAIRELLIKAQTSI